MTPKDELTRILYQALGEPIGLVLAVDGSARVARNKLYTRRNALGDPALNRLQVRFSPFAEGQLVIVKGPEATAQALPPAAGPAAQTTTLSAKDLLE